ncbi:hypothetical protein [Streptomyces sp. NPDC046759]|uniref:hypothetical protein n=1 Tax=Streptomyces sp. NPDC046759 TaxID=3155019 RepID=UPI0033D7BE13
MPYPWSEVLPFEFTESGSNSHDRLRLILRDREGHQLLRLTAQDVEQVARLLFEEELLRARSARERGETLVHGRFTLDTAGLAVDGEVHPWSTVREVSAEDRSFVIVALHGTWRRIQVPCSEVPHLRAVLTLARERRAHAGDRERRA